jgi:hypothetical protein
MSNDDDDDDAISSQHSKESSLPFLLNETLFVHPGTNSSTILDKLRKTTSNDATEEIAASFVEIFEY